MTRKQWTQEEITFLENNHEKLTADEISQALERSIISVKHKLLRNNLHSSKKWSDDEIKYLIEHYKTNTYKELSQYLNRSKSAIDLKINRLGLKKSKYNYDQSYFQNIDSEEKAYWLGFIMADGSVSKNEDTNSCELVIKLQISEEEHLKKFNKSLMGNIPVTIHERNSSFNNQPYKYCQIRLYSERIFHDLSKYGVIPAKSLIKQFPDNIPDNFQKHYIRGYFDGNGTIVISGKKNQYISCSFCSGSDLFLSGLKDTLMIHGIKSGVIYKEKDKNSFVLKISGMSNVDNFFRFIYSDSSIYLNRKYNKYTDLYRKTDMERRLLRQIEKSGQN